MTPIEYSRAATAFHKQHKIVEGQLLSAAFGLSAAKMGKSLPGAPDFIEVVTRQRALLAAMLELTEEVLSDA